jgi:hypothetical protein
MENYTSKQISTANVLSAEEKLKKRQKLEKLEQEINLRREELARLDVAEIKEQEECEATLTFKPKGELASQLQQGLDTSGLNFPFRDEYKQYFDTANLRNKPLRNTCDMLRGFHIEKCVNPEDATLSTGAKASRPLDAHEFVLSGKPTPPLFSKTDFLPPRFQKKLKPVAHDSIPSWPVPKWNPLTIVVVPDVFLDPACYTTLCYLRDLGGSEVDVRIAILPTYTKQESPGPEMGFKDDVQAIRKILQEELDGIRRDVIIIGHGYGALVGSSACRGMIRIPKPGRIFDSPRVASVQGIISMAGWVLGENESILLGGPYTVFDIRLRQVRSSFSSKQMHRN